MVDRYVRRVHVTDMRLMSMPARSQTFPDLKVVCADDVVACRGRTGIHTVADGKYRFVSPLHAHVFNPSHSEHLFLKMIGTVTSGIPSPTLGKNIAMAYVRSGWHKKGTEIEVDVRNKLRKAVVTPMPFIKPNYWRG